MWEHLLLWFGDMVMTWSGLGGQAARIDKAGCVCVMDGTVIEDIMV